MVKAVLQLELRHLAAMKNQPPAPSNMQVTRDASFEQHTVSQGEREMFTNLPPYAMVLLKEMKQTQAALIDGMHGMKQEMHSNKDELMHGMNQACARAAHAEEVSVKTASECHERMTHMQHIIDSQNAQLQLWQMQSELDRPHRADKINTVYIAPTPNNTSRVPFSSEQLDYSQAEITTKPNTRGGVEVKFASAQDTGEMLQKYPNIKNTQMPYRASYAKTPLQQRRDRLYTAIKQRLPRGTTGFMVKGQLYITTGAVSLAKKGEAPSDPYPAWLHAKITPAGMDIGDPINLESVPQYARQVIELAEYKHLRHKGNNTGTTPMRTLTDGGTDISDVEMADRFSRGRRSSTGETPGGKRQANK